MMVMKIVNTFSIAAEIDDEMQVDQGKQNDEMHSKSPDADHKAKDDRFAE